MYQRPTARPRDHWLAIIACVASTVALRCAAMQDAANETPEPSSTMSAEEARALAERIAAEMTAGGFPITADAVELMAAMGQWIGPLLASNPTIDTRATRELGTNSVLAQTCLATLAKGVIAAREHEDPNLQALTLLQSTVAVVGALTQPQPKKMKHGRG